MSDLVCDRCDFAAIVPNPIPTDPQVAFGQGWALGVLLRDHKARCDGSVMDPPPGGVTLDEALRDFLAGSQTVGGAE